MENKENYIKLFKQVEKLKNSDDPKRKYEYILWLGKKLKTPNNNILIPENKVQGCVSEVFVKASLQEGKLYWEGYSDALITRGLLAFLINGDIKNLKVCEQACDGVDYVLHQAALGSVPRSIEDPIATNEANINGFLNILLKMKSQANELLYD